jgi:hypothetical protein
VTIAMTTGDIAVIGKGLDGGEQVIIEGQNQVRPGGRVAPSGVNGPGGAPAAPGRGPDSDRGRGKRGEASASEPSSDAAPPAGGRPGGAHGAAAPAGAAAQRSPVTGKAESPRGPAAGPTASNQPAAP